MRAIAIWVGVVFFALSVVRSLVFSVRSAGRGEYALVPLGLIFVAVNGWLVYLLLAAARRRRGPRTVAHGEDR